VAADSRNYRVVVTNVAGTAASSSVGLVVLIPPRTNNFRSAEIIGDLSVSVSGSNFTPPAKRTMPAQLNAGGTASSIWYRWTPTAGGLAVIDTVGSAIDTVLAVYNGTSLSTLNRLVQTMIAAVGRTMPGELRRECGVHLLHRGRKQLRLARENITLGWQLVRLFAIATTTASQTNRRRWLGHVHRPGHGHGPSHYQWRRNGEAIPGGDEFDSDRGQRPGGSDASYTGHRHQCGGSSVTAVRARHPCDCAPALTNHLPAQSSRRWQPALVARRQRQTRLSRRHGGAIISSARQWANLDAAQFRHKCLDCRRHVRRGGSLSPWPTTVSCSCRPTASSGSHVASGTAQRLTTSSSRMENSSPSGEGGTILTSTDARVWTPRNSGTTNWLHGLAYNPRIRHFRGERPGRRVSLFGRRRDLEPAAHRRAHR
jgi:hypothetical protein